MSRVRINDLARQIGVKSKRFLTVLPLVGIAKKRSLSDEEADSVRAYLRTHPARRGGRPQFIVTVKDEPKPRSKRKNLNLVKARRTGSGVSGIYNWSERGGFPYLG